MKYCGNCGTQLEDEQLFCDKCGTKVENYEKQEEQGTSLFAENDIAGNNQGFVQFPSNGTEYNDSPKEVVKNRKKTNKGLIIGIVAAVLLVLALIGMYAEKYAQNKIENEEASIKYGEQNKEPQKEIPFSKGVVSDTTYESKFLDLRFTIPDGWAFRTNDEILEVFGAEGASQLEMSVMKISSGENVHLITEPVPVKNATLEQLKNALTENFKKAGMLFIANQESVMIGGQNYDVMDFHISNGTAIVNTRMYVRIQGDRLVYFMAQFLPGNDANVQPVLDSFKSY